MQTMPANLSKRLLYIIHRGLTQARNLALGQNCEQIADLADALEILPGYVKEDCSEDDVEMIRFVLRNYQEKYPGSCYDYTAMLDQYDPPDRY